MLEIMEAVRLEVPHPARSVYLHVIQSNLSIPRVSDGVPSQRNAYKLETDTPHMLAGLFWAHVSCLAFKCLHGQGGHVTTWR